MTCPDLTPVILTYNEEPNLARTLEALRWAKRIIVVDSGSTDGTEAVARSHPNVEWLSRRFDRHREQWAYAIHASEVTSEWVLALDADMIVPERFVDEFQGSLGQGAYAGGIVPFVYRAIGRDLSGSLYPPDLRVFRPPDVRIIQDGHTQRFLTDGPLYRFRCRVAHDDRKPLDRWIEAQLRYSSLECSRYASGGAPRGLKSRLRMLGIMPLVGGLLAYIRAGGPLKGSAALEYAYERMTFESLLAMRMLRQDTVQSSEPLHLEAQKN
jgi:glycosyltransferase involved in cell wall biosynthesis